MLLKIVFFIAWLPLQSALTLRNNAVTMMVMDKRGGRGVYSRISWEKRSAFYGCFLWFLDLFSAGLYAFNYV